MKSQGKPNATAGGYSGYSPVALEISSSSPQIQQDQPAVIIEDAFVYDYATVSATAAAAGGGGTTHHLDDMNRTALRMVASEYADIPETRGLVWEDDFFDDDDDSSIVAVFDFDYDLMESYYSSVGWCCFGASVLYAPLFAMGVLCLVPCVLRQNVRWNVQAQHVAVTRDGIRFVRDKRRTCWGWQCTDAGKSSKTVPFDKITDCDLEEPAGNTCLVIPNVLVTVNIDTASSGGGGGDGRPRHELKISGLKDAKRFKQLVWAMKRRDQHQAPLIAAQSMVERDQHDNNDVAELLREIRDELRTNNNLLVTLKNGAPQVSDGDEELLSLS